MLCTGVLEKSHVPFAGFADEYRHFTQRMGQIVVLLLPATLVKIIGYTCQVPYILRSPTLFWMTFAEFSAASTDQKEMCDVSSKLVNNPKSLKENG